MKLDRIHIEGYKSIRRCELELRNLNILIGANGSGKSNFISLFKLVSQMLRSNLQAFIKSTVGNPDTYFYFGPKNTASIKTKFNFDEGKNSYEVKWTTNDAQELIIIDECCYFQDKNKYPNPVFQHLARYSKESELPEFINKHEKSIPSYVYRALRDVKTYHFHDTSNLASVRRYNDINQNEVLHEDAGNLAAFLWGLQHSSRKSYEKIRNTVSLVAPFFDDFNLRPNKENRNQVRLEWKQKGSDYIFGPNQLSDGTLRFICLVTVLLQPNPPSTIIIDEPELGLHPYAISVLGGLMRSAASEKNERPLQLIVSTQSVEMVNQFQLSDIVIVEQDENTTTLKRLSEEEVKHWLEDYSVGEMWLKNILGGRP